MDQTQTKSLRNLFETLRQHFGGTPEPLPRRLNRLTWPAFNLPNDEGQRPTGPTLAEIARQAGIHLEVKCHGCRNERLYSAELVELTNDCWINLCGLATLDVDGFSEMLWVQIAAAANGRLEAVQR